MHNYTYALSTVQQLMVGQVNGETIHMSRIVLCEVRPVKILSFVDNFELCLRYFISQGI